MPKKPYNALTADHRRNLTRVIAGAKAKRAGALFEDELELSAVTYRQKGIAVFTRNFPPVAGPPGGMRFTGHGPVDFTGHWCGVPVAFDAKSTSGNPATWKFPADKLHQAKFLLDFQMAALTHNRQVFSFVLLRVGSRALYLNNVAALARGEATTLRAHRSTDYLVPSVPYTPLGIVPWDFLRCLMEAKP